MLSDFVDPFGTYLDPYTTTNHLNKLHDRNEHRLILVRGEGVSTFVDGYFQASLKDSLRVYIGSDPKNAGRFCYCHAATNLATYEHPSVECNTPTLEELLGVNHRDVAEGTPYNEYSAEQILDALTNIKEQRRQHYIHDKTLLFHNQIELFIDDANLVNEGTNGHLYKWLQSTANGIHNYKIRVWLGVSKEHASELMEVIERMNYTDIVLGSQVEAYKYTLNLHPSHRELNYGLMNYDLFPLKLPPLYWDDGNYRGLNTGFGIGWNQRLALSPVCKPTPYSIRLNPQRYYQFQIHSHTLLNNLPELEEGVEESYDEFPVYEGERLGIVYQELSEEFERFGFPSFVLDVVYRSSVSWVLQKYGSNEKLQHKAVQFIREYPENFLELMLIVDPMTPKVSQVYRVLSRTSLISNEDIPVELRRELNLRGFPTSKVAILSLYKLNNQIAHRMKIMGEYYMSHPEEVLVNA